MATYDLNVYRRNARPRSKRLRESGIAESGGGGSSVVMVGGGNTVISPNDHYHTNKSDLDQISTDTQGYMYLTRNVEVEDGEGGTTVDRVKDKVKAGLADKATDLTADSPIRDMFISRLADDVAKGNIAFEQAIRVAGVAHLGGGAEFGDFVKSLLNGKGAAINADGSAEMESLRVRSYFECMELIVNRLSAIEGDQLLTESDTIESVDDLGNSCYGLHLRSKWEGYFTAQVENNVLKGIINTLSKGNGVYHTSWMRVNSVNTASNYIEVTLYPDSEVPGAKNYPPMALMRFARYGNQTDAKRQSCLYFSSTEGRIVKLRGVTKPILDDANYGVALGALPDFVHELEDIDGFKLPIHDDLDYLYAPGIVTMDIIRLNRWTKKPIVNYVDRGEWAQGAKYYCEAQNTDTGEYETSDAWFKGCKYRCCKNLTTTAPAWNNTDWAMVEGNPNFEVDFREPESILDPDNLDLTLSIIATLYNIDVTDDIADSDVEWSRYSEDAQGVERTASDNVWTLKHANSGKAVHLTIADMDFNGSMPKVIRFTASVTLRDGMGNETATAEISYEY